MVAAGRVAFGTVSTVETKTLPWSWYADPEVLRREQEHIFRRTWQYVGHAGSTQNVGDRFSLSAATPSR